MKLLLLVLLPLILITSGCSSFCIPGLPCGKTLVEKSDVVVIKQFTAIPQTVYPEQPLKLVAFVENTGKDSVETQETQQGKQPIEIELFDYCKGLFDKISDIYCGSGQVDGAKCSIDKLLPGQIVETNWNLIPNKNTDLETSCDTKALVRYAFTTKSVTTMEFINQKELQNQIERGTLKPAESYITLGEGPVKPLLTVEDKQPIPVLETQESSGTVHSTTTVISLQLDNRGDGFLKDGYVEADKINIDFTNFNLIEPAGECYFEPIDGTKIWRPKGEPIEIKGSNGDTIEKNVIKFIKDKSPKMLCQIKISEYVPQITTRTVTTTVSYTYEHRKIQKVTVKPKI